VYALAGEHVAQLLVIRAQDLRILQKMLRFVRDKCADDACTESKIPVEITLFTHNLGEPKIVS
jgi:hypothetical protein